MGQRGFDVLVVRQSGPVHTMKFRGWWVYFLFTVLLLMLAGLGAASYVLYKHQETLETIAADNSLLMLRTERLEALAQEEETRQVLAQKDQRSKGAAPKPAKEPPPEPAKPQPVTTSTTVTTTTSTTAAANEESTTTTTEAPAPPPEEAPAEPAAPAAQTGDAGASERPDQSDKVAVRDIRQRTKGQELTVTFKVANAQEGGDTAEGFVTVLLRSSEAGEAKLEAWPPMRLDDQGLPRNYRRGQPFTVKRYRTMRASFSLADKAAQTLEFVVYDREGNLLLVHSEPLAGEAGTEATAGDRG